MPVHALGTGLDVVRWSRFCDEFVDLGDERVQERWLEWLLERAPAGAVVLACSDDGVELVARQRAAIEARGLIATEQDDQLALALLDKQRTFEVATRAGVPAPLCLRVRDLAELRAAAERSGFPCALKPVHSHLFVRHFDFKLFVAADLGELERAFAETQGHGLKMVLSELVPGPDSCFESYHAYSDADGEPLCELTKRKPRQYPVGAGTGTFHVTDWNPEVAELGRRFVRACRARGIAGIEFKRDVRDDGLKLIECNYRFTGALANQLAAGFDLPLFAYNHLTRRPLPRMSYRTGVRTWNPRQDRKALRDYRRRGELSRRTWLRSLAHRHSFIVARWDDPWPTLAYHAQLVRNKLRRKLSRRRD